MSRSRSPSVVTAWPTLPLVRAQPELFGAVASDPTVVAGSSRRWPRTRVLAAGDHRDPRRPGLSPGVRARRRPLPGRAGAVGWAGGRGPRRHAWSGRIRTRRRDPELQASDTVFTRCARSSITAPARHRGTFAGDVATRGRAKRPVTPADQIARARRRARAAAGEGRAPRCWYAGRHRLGVLEGVPLRHVTDAGLAYSVGCLRPSTRVWTRSAAPAPPRPGARRLDADGRPPRGRPSRRADPPGCRSRPADTV